MARGAIELDTCNNVQLRGPANIMHDPASALPSTQGVITAIESNVRKKVYRWTVEARPRLCRPCRQRTPFQSQCLLNTGN